MDSHSILGYGARTKVYYQRALVRSYGLAEAADFDDFCRWLSTSYGSDKIRQQPLPVPVPVHTRRA